MRKKTKIAFERHLNALYADMYSYEQAKNEFMYLTVPARGNHTTMRNLDFCINTRSLGSLLRRYDPIAFNVSFNEWPG